MQIPPTARKIPELTALFWAMKIAATTLGETAGDLLSMTLQIGYLASSLILFGVFAVTLLCQVLADRYHPALYWTVILATSTAGTTMSDFMDRSLGLGYAMGSAILVGLLAATLLAWRCTGRSLAVDAIADRRSELFYWSAILLSNTLGTALGDFLADDSGLGFAGGAMLIGCLLAALVALSLVAGISRTLLFWLAFILTRPFGATLGDVLTKHPEKGGLGLGTVGSSAALLLVLLLGLAFAQRAQQTASSALT